MTNQAAYLDSKQGHPLSIRDVEIPQPNDNEIVVESFAAGLNPVDWKIQKYGAFLEDFPFILGEDAAGKVHAVGKEVSHFKVGDRVAVYSIALHNRISAFGTFQKYVRCDVRSVFKLPDKYSYNQGATIGLCSATAAHGLYSEKMLDLPLPGTGANHQKTILIYGGSSSVGQFAIQFAKQSGFKVVSTASSKNQDLVKRCGADQVFDHNDNDIADQLKKAGPFECAYDSISSQNSPQIVSEAIQPKGGSVLTVLPWSFKAPSNVTTCSCYAVLVTTEDKLKNWFRPYMEDCLAKSALELPPVQEVSGGLPAIQKALDEYAAKGVSGKKLIMTGL